MSYDTDICDSAGVLVMITRRKLGTSRAPLLRRLFSDPMFEIHEVGLENISHQPEGSTSIDHYESMLVRKALSKARKLDRDRHVIVISDCIVSNSNTSHIKNVVLRCLDVRDFDLMYLNRYLDMCQLMTRTSELEDVSTEGTSIMRTQAPGGSDAILYTPTGRDIVLGYGRMTNDATFIPETTIKNQLNIEIYRGNLSAICAVPNLFEYDTILNAIDNNDYLRTNTCAPIIMTADDENGVNVAGIILLVIIIIFAIILAWALLTVGPG